MLKAIRYYAAISGDLRAQRALVDRHGPLLLAICRGAPEPEDAWQERLKQPK